MFEDIEKAKVEAAMTVKYVAMVAESSRKAKGYSDTYDLGLKKAKAMKVLARSQQNTAHDLDFSTYTTSMDALSLRFQELRKQAALEQAKDYVVQQKVE